MSRKIKKEAGVQKGVSLLKDIKNNILIISDIIDKIGEDFNSVDDIVESIANEIDKYCQDKKLSDIDHKNISAMSAGILMGHSNPELLRLFYRMYMPDGNYSALSDKPKTRSNMIYIPPMKDTGIKN